MKVILVNILVALTALAAIISIPLWKKASNAERAFILFIINNAFFEFLSTFIIRIGFTNNLPCVHAYTLIHFILMTVFFGECFKVLKINIKYEWILFLGSFIIIANSVFIQSIYTFNSYSKPLVDLYIMVCSVILFITLIKDRKHNRQELKPSVSFTASTYLSSSISFVIFLFGNVIMSFGSQSKVIGLIWNLRVGINYLVIIITFYGLNQLYIKNNNNAELSLNKNYFNYE